MGIAVGYVVATFPILIALLADLGVLRLLCVIGMELSLRAFRRIWRIALATVALQTASALFVVWFIGQVMGWPTVAIVLLAFVLALSSTAVAVKILEDIGENGPALVDVQVSCATKPMHVRMDLMMLRRGVDNILRNAIQAVYAAKPTGGGHVLLRAYSLEKSAFIEVRDNGPGIDPDALQKIFSPFYTSTEKGTGLGLAISKKVVDAHGGSLEAHSGPGTGADFLLTFPKNIGNGTVAP